MAATAQQRQKRISIHTFLLNTHVVTISTREAVPVQNLIFSALLNPLSICEFLHISICPVFQCNDNKCEGMLSGSSSSIAKSSFGVQKNKDKLFWRQTRRNGAANGGNRQLLEDIVVIINIIMNRYTGSNASSQNRNRCALLNTLQQHTQYCTGIWQLTFLFCIPIPSPTTTILSVCVCSYYAFSPAFKFQATPYEFVGLPPFSNTAALLKRHNNNYDE